jgi:hypothetical protein
MLIRKIAANAASSPRRNHRLVIKATAKSLSGNCFDFSDDQKHAHFEQS